MLGIADTPYLGGDAELQGGGLQLLVELVPDDQDHGALAAGHGLEVDHRPRLGAVEAHDVPLRPHKPGEPHSVQAVKLMVIRVIGGRGEHHRPGVDLEKDTFTENDAFKNHAV